MIRFGIHLFLGVRNGVRWLIRTGWEVLSNVVAGVVLFGIDFCYGEDI